MDAEDEYLAVYSRAERTRSRLRRMSGTALTNAARWLRGINSGEAAQASAGSLAPPPVAAARADQPDRRNAAALLGLREIAARLDGGSHPGD